MQQNSCWEDHTNARDPEKTQGPQKMPLGLHNHPSCASSSAAQAETLAKSLSHEKFSSIYDFWTPP